MSVPGKLLQPSLMFACKPEAYPSEALFKYSAIGWPPGLTHKHLTRLEMHAGDKHSSLLHKFVNYGPWSASRFGNAKHSSLFLQKVIYGRKSFITVGYG